MSKLLRADFSRLRKSKVFWFSLSAMVIYAFVLAGLLAYSGKISVAPVEYDRYFLSAYGMMGFVPIPGLIMAAFCSVFIGTDFSDGTIRNRLVVGHTRPNIYLSHFLVCTAAGILMLIAFWIPSLAVGLPLFGSFQHMGSIYLWFILDGFLMMASYAGILTMLSMLIQNKTTAAIVSLLLVIVSMFLVVYLLARIEEPEFVENYTLSVSGMTNSETVPNPYYLTPGQRTITQFVLDLIPTGQSMQLSGMSAPHLWQMAVYSLGIVLVTNISGIFFFRKKDLK